MPQQQQEQQLQQQEQQQGDLAEAARRLVERRQGKFGLRDSPSYFARCAFWNGILPCCPVTPPRRPRSSASVATSQPAEHIGVNEDDGGNEDLDEDVGGSEDLDEDDGGNEEPSRRWSPSTAAATSHLDDSGDIEEEDTSYATPLHALSGGMDDDAHREEQLCEALRRAQCAANRAMNADTVDAGKDAFGRYVEAMRDAIRNASSVKEAKALEESIAEETSTILEAIGLQTLIHGHIILQEGDQLLSELQQQQQQRAHIPPPTPATSEDDTSHSPSERAADAATYSL